MDDFAKILEEWEKNNNYIDKDSSSKKSSPQKNVKKRVQKEFKIDLHGMSVKEAIAHLKREILKAQTSTEIKVFIIHGAGNHSNGKSVLKESVLKWLNENKNLFNFYRAAKSGEGSSGVTIAYIKPK